MQFTIPTNRLILSGETLGASLSLASMLCMLAIRICNFDAIHMFIQKAIPLTMKTNASPYAIAAASALALFAVHYTLRTEALEEIRHMTTIPAPLLGQLDRLEQSSWAIYLGGYLLVHIAIAFAMVFAYRAMKQGRWIQCMAVSAAITVLAFGAQQEVFKDFHEFNGVAQPFFNKTAVFRWIPPGMGSDTRTRLIASRKIVESLADARTFSQSERNRALEELAQDAAAGVYSDHEANFYFTGLARISYTETGTRMTVRFASGEHAFQPDWADELIRYLTLLSFTLKIQWLATVASMLVTLITVLAWLLLASPRDSSIGIRSVDRTKRSNTIS